MNAGGDDLAIRKGIEAAVSWPDFARNSMEAQFDAFRHIGDQATLTPPAVPHDSAWFGLNAIVAAARAIENARWFGVPAPPEVATLAAKGEEED